VSLTLNVRKTQIRLEEPLTGTRHFRSFAQHARPDISVRLQKFGVENRRRDELRYRLGAKLEAAPMFEHFVGAYSANRSVIPKCNQGLSLATNNLTYQEKAQLS
jgi:hypothetical protein